MTLDWRDEKERATACQLLQKHAAESSDAPQAPLLIKHAVSDWPALTKWNLNFFQEYYPKLRVSVRCSPSMNFYYVEPRLLPAWNKLQIFHRQSLPPSLVQPMTMERFIRRMQTDCNLPHVVYPDDGPEFYYMQSVLPTGLVGDIDLYSPPLSCLGQPGVSGPNGSVATEPSGLPIAQIPRIYASPAGAVSPLHYDTASSFLTQIRGRKRLVFYQPKDLQSLYPYHRLHILRRRSKVDITDPDLRKYPKFENLVATEAMLDPGDVLWFPGYWSHYTESQSFSISMTYRFWSEQRAKRPKRGLIGLLTL